MSAVPPRFPVEDEVSPMRRIQIKVKRPRPTPVVELDLRTPSGRRLPY
ncbi:hypothetical protein GCM10023195_03860 [Actinoallomurus liliacearum]|uniref:Uncharacterized protein n=1 Tax=Actinoallomurus liliacearum TaxID=1080073 RepID=A0ABP8TDC0_9ACTN